MTAIELFDKTVADEHPDVLREAVRGVLHEIMAEEVSALLHDPHSSRTRSVESRTDNR